MIGSLKLNYTEKAVFLITASSRELESSSEELRAVKTELKLKYLDKIVNIFQFPGIRKYRAFSLQGVYVQDNADLI